MVGWYSTGPKLKEADLDINSLMSKYTENGEPVLVICEVQVGCYGCGLRESGEEGLLPNCAHVPHFRRGGSCLAQPF